MRNPIMTSAAAGVALPLLFSTATAAGPQGEAPEANKADVGTVTEAFWQEFAAGGNSTVEDVEEVVSTFFQNNGALRTNIDGIQYHIEPVNMQDGSAGLAIAIGDENTENTMVIMAQVSYDMANNRMAFTTNTPENSGPTPEIEGFFDVSEEGHLVAQIENDMMHDDEFRVAFDDHGNVISTAKCKCFGTSDDKGPCTAAECDTGDNCSNDANQSANCRWGFVIAARATPWKYEGLTSSSQVPKVSIS